MVKPAFVGYDLKAQWPRQAADCGVRPIYGTYPRRASSQTSFTSRELWKIGKIAWHPAPTNPAEWGDWMALTSRVLRYKGEGAGRWKFRMLLRPERASWAAARARHCRALTSSFLLGQLCFFFFFFILQLQSQTSVNHREWKRWHMALGEGSDSCHRWDVWIRNCVILYVNIIVFSKVIISGALFFGILFGCGLPTHPPSPVFIDTLISTLWVWDMAPPRKPRRAVSFGTQLSSKVSFLWDYDESTRAGCLHDNLSLP